MSTLLKIANCDDPNRRGDVVFIHGVQGDGRSTWHPKNEPEKFWPDWIAQDFPDLGVWSLDYDVPVSAWSGSGMPLLSRSTNCLELLKVHDLGGRPIIFITHSLGGLLTKAMLRRAADSAQDRVIRHTRGVAFLATPHTGTQGANWLDSIRGYLPLRLNEIVRNLRDSDAALLELNQWYRNHATKNGILTKSFYEESKTKGVMVVVDRASADPGIPGEAPIPLDADHLTICKPTSRNHLLHLSIRRFIQDCMAPRSDGNASRSDGNASRPPATSRTLEPSLAAQVDLQVARCKSRDLKFRSPHLLAALLDVQPSFAAACFEAARPGSAGLVRAVVDAWVSGQDGVPGERGFTAVAIEAHRTVAAAFDLARNESLNIVDQRHLFMALLASPSSLRDRLQHDLGEPEFARLTVIAAGQWPGEEKTGPIAETHLK